MVKQEDFLRPLVEQIVQQVLEAEMDETLGAEKSERTPHRLGYRSGYYPRTLVTRVGKLEPCVTPWSGFQVVIAQRRANSW